MDLYQSIIADIIHDVRLQAINRPRDNVDGIAMKVAEEYREELRKALARTFEERE